LKAEIDGVSPRFFAGNDVQDWQQVSDLPPDGRPVGRELGTTDSTLKGGQKQGMRSILKAVIAAGLGLAGLCIDLIGQDGMIEISTIQGLAHFAAQSGHTIRMAPGVYSMADYLADEVLDGIRQEVAGRGGRPTVRMMAFSGSGNTFHMEDVILEIETELYPRLPRGYVRCLYISGDKYVPRLTIRNTGPNQGSSGNILAIFGQGNTLEEITLKVFGSAPYGYGDLLGKGGPNLVGLQKQSGIQIMGSDTTLRRNRVFSRAFGHCFYIQAATVSCWRTAMPRESCARRTICCATGRDRHLTGISSRSSRTAMDVSRW
jgi:hypothetical protein